MGAIERNVDKLGRVVLPISYRKKLGLTANSKVCISIEEGVITITSATASCALCGNDRNLHSDIRLCEKCISIVKQSH